MSDYSVSLLTRMLEIYSPSGKEEEISNFLAKEMEDIGFRVRKDKIGNVIGEIGQGKPVILLCGHMDTVEGYIPVRVENSKLYGRGAVDAKAPLAAMIVAASTFLKEDFPGKILVVGVVDEEGSGRGIKHFIKEGIQPDYAIFGEPSGIGKIVFGYKGILNIKITCETPSGHSAAPWLFDNAIEKAMEIWRQIQKLHLREEKLKSRFYSTTSCLTKINGGNASSMIPSKCDIYVQLRIPPQFTPEQVFNGVKRKIKRYKATNPKVSVKTKMEGVANGFEADRRSVLVRALAWAIRKTTLNYASFSRKTGTGDMNVLGNALKIPVVTYGPGDSRLDHTPNEHIDLKEYLVSIKVYRKAIMKLPELLKNRRTRMLETN
ncbi:MAG: M20/M25/M40 family metallo-hydrolase [Candidatus Bathyarchaeota archaeon]|nr:M20/M25/M40 family metallo-hydrolase [Candidatus Bathyarchaeota archaeon]